MAASGVLKETFFVLREQGGEYRIQAIFDDINNAVVDRDARLVDQPGKSFFIANAMSGVSVQDEGALVIDTDKLNFTGDGVTVTAESGIAKIDIPPTAAHDRQETAASGEITTTSTTFVDTGLTLTTASGATRDYIITFAAEVQLGDDIQIVINVDGSDVLLSKRRTKDQSGTTNIPTQALQTIGPGKVVKVRWRSPVGSMAKMRERSLIIDGA